MSELKDELIDPVTGLPIVDGKIDLSNGIPWSQEERAAYRASLAKLAEALAALPAESPQGTHEALRVVHALRPLLPLVPGDPTIVRALADAVEAVLGALGL